MATQAQGLTESYFNVSYSLYLGLIFGRKRITTPFNREQGEKLFKLQQKGLKVDVREHREGGWTLGNVGEDIGLVACDLDNSDLTQTDLSIVLNAQLVLRFALQGQKWVMLFVSCRVIHRMFAYSLQSEVPPQVPLQPAMRRQKGMIEKLPAFIWPEIIVTQKVGIYYLYSGCTWTQLKIQLLLIEKMGNGLTNVLYV